VNLATGVAYVDGRTDEGRAAGAGSGGGRERTTCAGEEKGGWHGAWLTAPQQRFHKVV